MSESDHYLAIPRRGAGPGALVLHSWWGLNHFFRDLCDRLAAEGFVALAPDLFGGKTATSVAGARRLRAAATRARREPAYKLLTRKIDCLVHHDAVVGKEIGVLGCSMGGHWAFWLAQRPEFPIAATVAFYAARGGDFTRARCSFLCHLAEHDDFVSGVASRKLIRDLASAGRPATVYEYPGTAHWFFESDRAASFESGAADLAWKRTVRFFKSELVGGSARGAHQAQTATGAARHR